jgi:hypothetical protein
MDIAASARGRLRMSAGSLPVCNSQPQIGTLLHGQKQPMRIAFT